MTDIKEEKANLFDLDNSWALAHCVGVDLLMGKGIAVTFKKKFGNVDWLIEQKKTIGDTLLLPDTMTDRNVFYMITKKWSKYSKPTYDDIEKCLIDMFNQASLLKINKIAMPKIGCGLDGKNWIDVKNLIIKHKPKDIDILIRFLD
jgi:O-acetyl-ADP-ribose deacetylase (regulator of RNase III)